MQHWHCFRWVQAPQMWNSMLFVQQSTGHLSAQWRPPKSLFKRWSAHSSSFLRLRPRSTQQARLLAHDWGDGAEGGEGEGGEGNCNVSEELELDL